jgi:hypothetical protein
MVDQVLRCIEAVMDGSRPRVLGRKTVANGNSCQLTLVGIALKGAVLAIIIIRTLSAALAFDGIRG